MLTQERSTARVGVVAALIAMWLVAVAAFEGPIPNSTVTPEDALLRIDPNVATREELMLLPGVGPAIADRILADRGSTTRPAYATADDLQRIRGLGRTKVDQFRRFLKFGSSVSTSNYEADSSVAGQETE